MNYKSDILIDIFYDTKNQKKYLMNVTSKKIYSCPDDLRKKRRKSKKRVVIEIVVCVLLCAVPLYFNPTPINNPSQGLIVMMLLLGLFGSILISMSFFLIARKYLNQHLLTEKEYLELHPKLGVVRDIIEAEKVIGRVQMKSKVTITAIMLFIIGAIACFILFYRTYISNFLFFAATLVLLTFVISLKLKETLYVIKVVQERKVKKK